MSILHALNLRGIWLLLKDSVIAWDEDNIATQGAALAFFTVFSLAPLLVMVVVFSSLGFGREAANGHLVSQIRGLVGTEGATFVQSLITNAYKSGSNILATVFSVVMIVLGASAVFVQLRDSLNTIWRVQQKPTGTIRGFLRGRVLSFAMIVGIGFLLLVSLVVSAGLVGISNLVSRMFPGLDAALSVLDFTISFIGITVMFALMFKFVPAAVVKWRDVWVGAAVTSLLFAIGKLLIGFYLGNGAVGSTFGAARSLVVIMLWAYYSSQIVLFGAEFTRLYSLRFGTRIVPSANADELVTRKVEARGVNPPGRTPSPISSNPM